MPLLLNVLRNTDGPDYRRLRVKAMECAGLIGASRFIFLFFLRLTDPVFLKQLPLAQMYSDLMQNCSSSCSCTSNVCRFIFLNCLIIGKLTKFACGFIYKESPPDPNDTQLDHYLIATWEKVCQAKGPEFECYLSVVMPSLLTTSGAKVDLSIYRAFTPLLSLFLTI